MNVISPKKLIEVALPLDAINVAAAREKSIRHGHPSTLHLWWARRPLAAARAVIFAQLVHDPEDLWRCQNPSVEPNQQVRGHWTKARAKLFAIIEDLVKWENTTNEAVLKPAREAIRQSWLETCELNKHHPQAKELFDSAKMPGLHDPFAGGGTIPLEAQRLGLEAFASDLNPVAVLINKAMIEIPPKFAGRPPVHPDARNLLTGWKGAAGLAEDVRRYGAWMRDEAYKRIGQLYPPIEITKTMVKDRPDLKEYEGESLTVIAWLWARTVQSPNPAFSHVAVPLASTFILSSKAGKEAYVDPVMGVAGYSFHVKLGKPPAEATLGTRAGKAQDFVCLMSRTAIGREYVRDEGKANRLGARLMAIVAEGPRGRVYLDPLDEQNHLALSVQNEGAVKTAHATFLSEATPTRAMITGGVCSAYGLRTWGDLFTARQLIALTTFSDLVGEAIDRIRRDAIERGTPDGDATLDDGGIGAKAYGEAIGVYLGFLIGQLANHSSSICGWNHPNTQMRSVFSRQSLTMTWDYAEVNIFSESSGSFHNLYERQVKGIEGLGSGKQGCAFQADAQQQRSQHQFISTDPPYYDNIAYAVLSDFFYAWIRRSLRPVYPNLLATISVPKAEELTASSYRHGTKQKAESYFLAGMTQVMRNLSVQAHPAAPMTIYYAFKQTETESQGGTSSNGWETFLDALLRSGLSLTGTWPIRTEKEGRSVSYDTNALASSIILVCRPRPMDADTISRRQFVRLLNATLPLALEAMTRPPEGTRDEVKGMEGKGNKSGNPARIESYVSSLVPPPSPLSPSVASPVAPVDLSQAIIGPGMAIFSRYKAVLEADGTPMTVKTALQLINRFLAEDDFDADTQFCLHWFEQHGWDAGKFGEADTLARAKGTSVAGVRQAGVVEAGGGNVRLLKWREYPADWDPATDDRLPVWEALHQLIRAYNTEGDSGAAKVLAGTAAKAEAARQLAYRLYTLCERRGWAEDARAYNEVVTGWSGIESAAVKVPASVQGVLFDDKGGS